MAARVKILLVTKSCRGSWEIFLYYGTEISSYIFLPSSLYSLILYLLCIQKIYRYKSPASLLILAKFSIEQTRKWSLYLFIGRCVKFSYESLARKTFRIICYWPLIGGRRCKEARVIDGFQFLHVSHSHIYNSNVSNKLWKWKDEWWAKKTIK